jgi:hypothetical protein
MSPQTTAAPRSTRTSSAILRRWPIAVGLLGAAFAAIVSPNRETVVISLLVALVCYLAAAALGVRWVSCAAIPVASALVVAGALIGIQPWFVLGGVAIALVIVGLVARASRTALAAQSLALVAYGGNRADWARALTCCRRRSGIADADGAWRFGMLFTTAAMRWYPARLPRRASSLMSCLVWPPWFWYSRVHNRPR